MAEKKKAGNLISDIFPLPKLPKSRKAIRPIYPNRSHKMRLNEPEPQRDYTVGFQPAVKQGSLAGLVDKWGFANLPISPKWKRKHKE
jgi:hypothetical protein